MSSTNIPSIGSYQVYKNVDNLDAADQKGINKTFKCNVKSQINYVTTRCLASIALLHLSFDEQISFELKIKKSFNYIFSLWIHHVACYRSECWWAHSFPFAGNSYSSAYQWK